MSYFSPYGHSKNKIKVELAELVTTAALNAKVNEFKGKIPDITKLATIDSLTSVENKIFDHSKYVYHYSRN